MTDDQKPPPRPRIDAVGVVVSDLARSLAFYEALGCRFEDHAPGDGHTVADLGGVRLMLDTEASIETFWPGTSWLRPGRVTLAAHCGTPADVDRLHDELSALGAGSEHSPFDAPWGHRYATVRDPDGSNVDLYAELPSAGG